MATTVTDPLLGQLVDGRYEVLRRIARGGMATVYLARDRRLDRDVALKVMHPHLAEGASGADFIARFRREARAAARLTHQGLVGVFDQGVDGETSYLTMEFVDGSNLRRRIGEQGALTVDESLRVTEEVLDALTAAHQAGLVHRDIKPENVLLGRHDRVKVADFGLARAVTEVTSTTTGTILGTVAYLAPELVAHGVADTRTDVYAVGILLFEMLTGSQPFTGVTPIQIAYQHVNSDVPPPSERVDWLPIELDELVGALTARAPDDRPTDAGQALALVRRTRERLDEETLARRADVPVVPAAAALEDEDPAGDPAGAAAPATGATNPSVPDDPDATTVLDAEQVAAVPLGRTMALRIGTGLPDAEPRAADPRSRRRLIGWLLIAFALVAALAGGAWWYMTSGPGAWTTVPTGLVGAELASAEQALTEHGLEVGAVTDVFDADVPAGSVVSADPGEGESVRKDGSVALDVSKGPQMTTVPTDLAGKPLDDVTAALTDAGLAVADPVQHDYDDVVAAGHVLSISPAEGSDQPVGTEMTVTVSDGPAPITVPNVVGTDAGDAKKQLEQDYGLKVTEEKDYSEDYPAGQVMAQSVPEGTEAHRKDSITITVSQGPPLVEVPDVLRNGVAAATKKLEEAGFVVEIKHASAYFGLGFVVEQDPKGGREAPKGSTVTITIT
ncbi:Stk1 family PASTA domain-containing Ser/Thr kinase [Actinotalea sp. M2MS4P-6]|uniref:Stk1 family PASTA domain-containing Ser/Thr kinase n=1 Tax=Actinotalea sp. M2MS4P-6 TaxID=2983762 RepID=UPI0021E38008|nr:Stk1 family PASTA domain-containing Ser/Thr kinase [Actinotalea sp. M2MS4P-6]MCV2396469.1 Stk1 family PASTA domain-containing Ser/Thr kinase [Actinotalea sp. M2MS4P-6]